MARHLLIYFVCLPWVCLAECEDATQNVTDTAFLVTNGTRELTLTCPNVTSYVDRYAWVTPGNKTDRCPSGESTKTCTFQPRIEDDNQIVYCLVFGNCSASKPLTRAFYRIDLNYPPTISVKPPKTEPLGQGEILTCSVNGGKPKVTSVTFYCQHPDHGDTTDDVSDDGRTVNSSITVDTSHATEVNMTCTCSANWDPESGLYSDQTNISLQLKYRAKVTSFTVNNTTTLSVNETSHSTVTFACQGHGRPSPVLKIYKQGNDSALIQAAASAISHRALYTINTVQGEDFATYRCEAHNRFPDPNNSTVKLLVYFTPPPEDVSIQTVTIVGPVVGGLLVIGIIVIIVICLRRRKLKASHKGHQGSQNRNQNNVPVTHTMSTFAAAHDSRPDSTATTTYEKINDGPSSAGCNTTAARCSTDSKGYTSVGDTSLQGSNKAAPTRRTNVQTLGYEDVELDPLGAPKVMPTPENPDVVAPMPEDSAERITGPKGDVYAVVGPKKKGDNL